MQRLVQAPNIAIASLWVDVLRQAGVEASTQRYFLGSVAGELPPDQCLPEVWLHDDSQLIRGQQVLDAWRNVPQRRWICACGELVEGGFERCWNCNRVMPGLP
jgi:hypothetical protein